MDIDSFISRWTSREGGAERANYQMFLSELCGVLEVPSPDPSGAERERNDYVFERAVRPRDSDGGTAPKRIDLYKRNAFILEAKQSRLPGKKNALPGQLSFLSDEPEQLGRRSVARGWDVMMQNARKQAENYVFLLDANHAAPPFIITCDVGHSFEIFADFTGTGRAYSQFPDRKGFRIFLEDLRKPEVRARLAAIWTDPLSLDPAKESARVTREIAARLAAVSKALEASHPAEAVAHFLMRCIFTMFAEDVDLLPTGSFTELLEDCLDRPEAFAPLVTELWAKMDEPERGKRFYSAFRTYVRHFNGNLFHNAEAFALGREEIGELLAASRALWTEVDPAIFGTLLEQALDKKERRKLGAHYTPRAYVQRLVDVTVMEPLRADWQAALTKAEAAKEDGDEKKAVLLVRAFHHQLCATRVLDPACGTGNFLYVSLELMKKLEGEVLETLARLGEPESMGLDRETVDPHQFLGLELNPRASAIAELVVWIGYLQQHYRTRSGHPSEPILRAFKNINFGTREGYDAVLTWDGYPEPAVADNGGEPIEPYPKPRRPEWPDAEFIVGNPPFVGGKDLRSRLAPGYAEALWAAHPQMNESADLVMYWWDRAAELLARKKTPLRRFGLVSTNSISQVLQRRVMERHLSARTPVSLIFAIPDHPWTKESKDAAAVRIAMTAVELGERDGQLWETAEESNLDADNPKVSLTCKSGRINSDLTAGIDVNRTFQLKANRGLCINGMKPLGSGFLVTRSQAELLGLGKRAGLEDHVWPYRNGRDLASHPRGVYAIDLWGLSAEQVRTRFPEVYQHLLETVKKERDEAARRSNTRDAQEYAERWWTFCKPRQEMREFMAGIDRFIVTIQTARHRVFQFMDKTLMPDQKLMVIGCANADVLSVLSSNIHKVWTLRTCSWLGVGNDSVYVKIRTFDPFPFPSTSEELKSSLSKAGEELDATRKRVLAQHPDLTLTGLYNVLEKVKGGVELTLRDEDVKARGLILILNELHETIDRLTAEAYGWPNGLSDDAILERLVALNAVRAKEEAAGHVQWVRPGYQIGRFGTQEIAKTEELDLGAKVVAIDAGLPAFPTERYEQPLAIEAMLLASSRPMDAAELSRRFKRGGKRIEQRIDQVLTTLARYGRVTVLADGRYASRAAA